MTLARRRRSALAASIATPRTAQATHERRGSRVAEPAAGGAAAELALLASAVAGRGDAARETWLLLAPHPDDETVGATWVLRRAPGLRVAFVTDGVPHDRRFWPRCAPARGAAYAALRRREARRALAMVGVGAHQIIELGLSDQEACNHLAALTALVVRLFERLQPGVVIVPPYEGGHPDHDATSFAAQAAARLLRRRVGSAPHLVEMGSYHRQGASLCTSAFLPRQTGTSVRPSGYPLPARATALQPAAVEYVLSPDERLLKQSMMSQFASQAEVLAAFGVARERFRAAPGYDFTRPPHPGLLHYESLGFPCTGALWRARARRALAQLDLCKPFSC